jgi:CheY-like chemotaxis protein
MALKNVATHTASRRRFVLVADSDARNLLYTYTLLKRFGYSVWTARTAAEALEIATVVTPVLIVTAQYLDNITGLELIRKLKRMNSSLTAPIIVLTCGTDPVNARACLAAGAIVCLPAPASVEDLYRVVQVAIEPVPRMNIRINTRLDVAIHNRAVDCGEGACARALSEHGTYIRIRNPYPLNTRLPLQIHRQTGNEQKNHPGMGLQFVRISQQDQTRIRTFIKNEITKDLRPVPPAQI